MTAFNLIDRLAAHRTLASAPREELAWLASHGTLRQMHTGEVLTAKGQTVQKGGVSKATIDLKAGTYEFYCPVDGHKAAGMVGKLTVQ